MKKIFKRILILAAVLTVMATVLAFSSSAADESNKKWIGAWGTGATEIGFDGYNSIVPYVGKVTMRAVITPTTSGTKARFKISNLHGDEDLVITRVTIAKSIKGSKVDPNSIKIVTFNEGYQNVTVAPGEEIYTDPVVFNINAGEPVALSIYAEEFTEVKTMGLSGADTYLTFGEDATSKENFALLPAFIDSPDLVKIFSAILGTDIDPNLGYKFIKVVPMVVNMDVLAEGNNAYSVVVIGDSTVANEFPLYLSERINAAGINNVGVVGKGIIGNRLLGNGLGLGSKIYGVGMLDRLDVDALQAAGVEYVVVKIGCNDIVHPVCIDVMEEYKDKGGIEQPTAQDIINGYQKVFDRCHEAGIKVVVVGITQWKGNTRNYFGDGDKYIRTDEEFNADWQIALDVNAWLAKTNAHDGYVNFNEISCNPKDPAALYPEYTIDGVHPSDTLQKLWAEKFPLSLIGIGKAVKDVKLDKTSTTLYVGFGKRLTATVSPADADNKDLIWSTSDPEIATVSQSGYVKAHKDGTAYITVQTVDGLYSATCRFKITTRVESVSLDKTSATMYTTDKLTLKPTIVPSNATVQDVTWSTSDKKVATVDSKGVVTAVGSGKCTITVTSVNKGRTATCEITVKKKTEVSGITLSKTSVAIYKTHTYTLKATVNPSNATYKNVKWTSSDSKIVKVDSKGKITALKAGTAYITVASTDNPMVKTTCKVKVIVATTSISLSTNSTTVYKGYTKTLKVTMSPSDATNKKVTWTSSDKKVATVDSKGVVKGVKTGTAYITCKSDNGGFIAKCKITVKNPTKTTGIKFAKSKLTIDDGTLVPLNASVSPSNATDKKIIYTSSNPKIAKVYASGNVYGVTPGTVTITAKTQDTGKVTTCKVTVKAVYPESVSLDAKSVTIDCGKSKQLTATVAPSNCSYRSVTWKSSNPKAVSVSSTGKIKGLKAGASATITCTTKSGSKVATCKVKVRSVAVDSVSLDKTKITLNADKTYRLNAKISPSNATNKELTWSSANTKICKVSSNGLLVPVSGGTTIVTCKTKDGGYTAYCVVTVKSVKVLGVALNKSSLIANKGATFTLLATVVPSNATNPAVTWKSTNTAVATVKNGVVKAVGVGSCEIKVYTVDGNYIATCKLKVV